MARILLLLEDFNELSFMESALKKVGFDTMGLLNETNLADKVMIFNPSVIMAYGRGNRFSGMSVAKKVKEMKTDAKVALIFSPEAKPQAHELTGMRLDVILETPLNLLRTIEVLARVCQIDAAPMVEKYNRIKGSLGANPPGWASQTVADPAATGVIPLGKKRPPAAPAPDSAASKRSAVDQVERAISSMSHSAAQSKEQADARKERLKEVLAQAEPIDVKSTTFSRKDLKKRMRDLKQDWDPLELADLDQQRKEFAEALFKKKSEN